jgi:hypothetical protein
VQLFTKEQTNGFDCCPTRYFFILLPRAARWRQNAQKKLSCLLGEILRSDVLVAERKRAE